MSPCRWCGADRPPQPPAAHHAVEVVSVGVHHRYRLAVCSGLEDRIGPLHAGASELILDDAGALVEFVVAEGDGLHPQGAEHSGNAGGIVEGGDVPHLIRQVEQPQRDGAARRQARCLCRCRAGSRCRRSRGCWPGPPAQRILLSRVLVGSLPNPADLIGFPVATLIRCYNPLDAASVVFAGQRRRAPWSTIGPIEQPGLWLADPFPRQCHGIVALICLDPGF